VVKEASKQVNIMGVHTRLMDSAASDALCLHCIVMMGLLSGCHSNSHMTWRQRMVLANMLGCLS